MLRARAIPLVVAAACGAARPAARVSSAEDARPATTEALLRVRCALDGREGLTTWTGAVYAFTPDAPPRRIFDVVGMNVARCLRDREGGWRLTSRELMYYLDPDRGAALDRWVNPWTGAAVPVVHVANRLVQVRPAGPIPMRRTGDLATLSIDVPVSYPNPLADDPALRAYSPAPLYQAAELFTFVAPADELDDPARARVSSMSFTWVRVGPWLPWMDMGDRPGYLVYSAHGRRVDGVAELPPILRAALADRMRLYRHAPACIVDAANETSWTYFAAHLADYQAGARFPLPAADDPHECPSAPAPR